MAVQNIVAEHLSATGRSEPSPEHAFIHINDTHPALFRSGTCPDFGRRARPRFFRKLGNGEKDSRLYQPHGNGGSFGTLARGHGAGAYAEDLRNNLEIDASFRKETGLSENKIRELSVIGGNEVRMAIFCVIASRKVNGVSKLHSEIIRTEVFGGYSGTLAGQIINVTNGIAHRRWLCRANPRLASLLGERNRPRV